MAAVNRTLLSITAGCVGAVLVAGSAWGLQGIALPPPTRADLTAAYAARWLHNHRLALDLFHVDRRRMAGACLAAPSTSGSSAGAPWSRFVVPPGPVVRVFERKGRTFVRDGRRPARESVWLAAHVGCTFELLVELGQAATVNGHLTMQRANLGGRPTIEIRLPQIQHERLTLYLAPKTYQPLVATARIRGHVVTARIFLPHPTRALLARFRAGSRGKPGRRR